MSKRAIILASGKGTRLKPYTVVLPKPLMPVGDYPILEVVIRQLVQNKFDHITIAVNHQAELIKTFFGDGSKWKIKIDYSFEEKDSVSKIVKVVNTSKTTVNLGDAKIIVAGGRGVGSKENFQLLEELADVLGAELGGSRITVEFNWLDPDRQIGQTGVTVSPKLYIACGISGAIQHIVGMENSDVIVAINKDPNAPIFNVAHYGIIGDIHEVIPILIEEIKSMNLNNNK